ncbi:MAG: hypothetical protein RL294_265 [Actinomycetota bacterium]|jgi:hypothetical protein
MTDKDNNDSRDDVDWLKDAFNRAIQGDNGTVPDAARPVVNPFAGLTPTSDSAPVEHVVPVEPSAPTTPIVPRESVEKPSNRHDLDLDFETDDMPPVTLFEPVIPVDYSIPAVATDYPPTEALDAVDLPATAVPELVAPVIQVVTPSATPSEETSGIDFIDALFSSTDTSAATIPISTLPVSPRPTTQIAPRESKPADDAKLRQRLLLIVAGILVVIVSIGAFLAGGFVASPAAAPTPEVTEAPVAPTTAQLPGEYSFIELFGGECLDPFDTAWASTFIVVDCATPHSAQLVYAGDLAADGSYLSYPGDDIVGNAAMAECSRKGVLNLASAKTYSDLLVSSAYPISAEAWDSGDTRYYCFVNLSSGDPIDGDLAGKLITRGAEATPEPTATP